MVQPESALLLYFYITHQAGCQSALIDSGRLWNVADSIPVPENSSQGNLHSFRSIFRIISPGEDYKWS